MSGDFIGSTGREFLKSQNRDRQTGRALGGGSIRYFAFRAGYAGDQGRVYRKLRGKWFREGDPFQPEINWVQEWTYRGELYSDFTRGNRPLVPNLVFESGKPPDVPHSGMGGQLDILNPENSPVFTGDNYREWPAIWRGGKLTIEWSDPVDLSMHLKPLEDLFVADTNFPGNEPQSTASAYPGAFRIRSVFPNAAVNPEIITPNDFDLPIVRKPAIWLAGMGLAPGGIGSRSPFYPAGTSFNDATALRPEDMKFLNNYGDGTWPICGFSLVINPALGCVLMKTNVERKLYKRAVFRRLGNLSYTPLTCTLNHSSQDGVLSVGTGEVLGQMQTRESLNGGKEFWGFAGGTGEPQTDLMSETYTPPLHPSCW
jgi:hypothetical protein